MKDSLTSADIEAIFGAKDAIRLRAEKSYHSFSQGPLVPDEVYGAIVTPSIVERVQASGSQHIADFDYLPSPQKIAGRSRVIEEALGLPVSGLLEQADGVKARNDIRALRTIATAVIAAVQSNNPAELNIRLERGIKKWLVQSKKNEEGIESHRWYLEVKAHEQSTDSTIVVISPDDIGAFMKLFRTKYE